MKGTTAMKTPTRVTPHLRAIDAVNPADEAFRDAYRSGITTVVTGPGSANVFGGQFAALKTFGRRIDDMVVKEPLCQKIAVGENPKSVYQEKNQTPNTRMATAALIRETLKKAQIYGQDLQKYQSAPEDFDRPEYDAKLEALLPLIKGDTFAKVHAHRSDDILPLSALQRSLVSESLSSIVPRDISSRIT